MCTFLRSQRDYPTPSSAVFGRIGEAYVREIHRIAEREGIPMVHFQKGENKEAMARPLIEAAAREGGKGRVGIAQEEASAWWSWVATG